MESHCNSADPILAAAYSAIMDVGIRRTTIAEIARRAGVSRMTVYRAYDDLEAVVSALLTSELVALISRVQARLAHLPQARERLARGSVAVVTELAAHPLMRRVLDLDPALLLPFVVDRLGSTQRAALAAIAAELRAGLADGSVRALDVEVAAVSLLLTVQSFVLAARILAADPHATQLHDELHRLVDAYLRPELAGAP